MNLVSTQVLGFEQTARIYEYKMKVLAMGGGRKKQGWSDLEATRKPTLGLSKLCRVLKSTPKSLGLAQGFTVLPQLGKQSCVLRITKVPRRA